MITENVLITKMFWYHIKKRFDISKNNWYQNNFWYQRFDIKKVFDIKKCFDIEKIDIKDLVHFAACSVTRNVLKLQYSSTLSPNGVGGPLLCYGHCCSGCFCWVAISGSRKGAGVGFWRCYVTRIGYSTGRPTLGDGRAVVLSDTQQ